MMRFIRDETGTTSIEYALIALILGVGIISAVQLLGSQVQSTFSAVEAAYKGA
jgi:Flp pilus assembly pilin Flp